jgi:hypothetical protein
MTRISLLLAQIDPKDSLVPDLQKTSGSRGGLIFLFAAVGIVTLLIVVWAIFVRKRPDDSSRRYSYPSRSVLADGPPVEHSSRRRRRRRRRPRNPTLAQTGGLPPIRADGYYEDPP